MNWHAPTATNPRRLIGGQHMNIRAAASHARSLPLGLGRRGLLPNLYDLIIFIFIAAAFVAVAHGIREMEAPLAKLEVAPVTLNPAYLPEYALRTTLRMFAARIPAGRPDSR